MSDPHLPILSTARLILRPATRDDVPSILDYFVSNREHLAPSHPRWADGFFTLGWWERQVANNLEQLKHDRALRMFVFEAAAPATVVGTVNFTEFSRGPHQACNLGYGLAKDRQGRGYMLEALQASIPYVFRELRMHRIMANYMPHNRRSGALLRKLGFTVEGYARDYLLLAGRWEDHILTSLTNPDWMPADGENG